MTRVALVGLALLAVAACDDPAKNKTKAQVSEATAQAAAPVHGASYEIDPATSKIEWTGSKVTASHDGGFKSFHGAVVIGDVPEDGAVNVTIDTDSLYTTPDKLVAHLKSPDFFDVARFPTASFASTSLKKGGEKGASHTVTGNLTLHGVTKSISFPATIKAGPRGVDVDTEFTIDRKDFGMVYPGKADDLIRDGVVIKLTIRSHPKS